MANRATAPLHSRMSSVATTNTAATYGLLDYYADSDNDHDEVDDEEESLNFGPIHQQNNKSINNRFSKSSSPNPIQEEIVSTIRVPNNDESLNLTNLSRTEFIELQKKISSNLSISDTAPTSSFMRKSKSKSKSKLSSANISDFDIYGFKKTNQYISNKDYTDWWNEYHPYLIRRKSKWIKFLQKNGLYLNSNDSIPTKFPLKSDEMSKFIKKGIPAEWRGSAWFSFVGGFEKLKENSGFYDELLKQSIDLNNENTDAIEKDLHRTFPDNIYFKEINNKEPPMLSTLRRVLKIFSLYKPSIGYCQSLNFITGLLLLFMNEEQTFWMLVIITEKFLPGVHESNLEGLAINQGMLLLCLKQHLPDVWKIIVDNDNDNDTDLNDNSYLFYLPTLTFCTTSWFMSLFIGVLPIETTLRIWDIIFYENSKSIFQISLGIFKMLDPDLRKFYCKAHGLPNNSNLLSTIKSESDLINIKLNNKSNTSLSESSTHHKDFLSSELFQLIQNTPKRIINVNLFIDECFRSDSSTFYNLSQSEITRCRNFVISSRDRYLNLIEKRNQLGMSPNDRRDLLKQERELNYSKYGNNVWDKRGINGLNNNNSGLKTAYWNVGLNRRIKKIYSKGQE